MSGPLANLRVVDFTWVLAGSFASKTLADMGAQVIKIENPSRPDILRFVKNWYDELPDASPHGYFNNFNRNKIGIAVNLRHPEGLNLIKKLISVSDVVMENFRGGVMARLGLSYEEMCKVKPDIIYVSGSGYGHTGPYKDYAAHFHIAQGLSGLTYLSGYPNDLPVATGAIADTNLGLYMALGVLIALEHRNKTGEGQWVDVAMLSAMVSNMDIAFLDYTINGRIAEATGIRIPHPAAVPHGAYRCQGEDRWCAIAVSTEEEWQAFCRAIDRPDLVSDPRFSTITERTKNWQALEREVEAWTLQRSAEEAMDTLQAAGVSASIVESIEDMIERDEHLKARGFYPEAWHPEAGMKKFDGVVIKMSETPGEVHRGAPLLGEFNEFVFGEILGLTKEEIQKYREDGVF